MKESKCEICEKKFSNKYLMLQHYNHLHNDSGKIHKCNVCAKTLSTQNCLKKHIQTVHRGNKKKEKY